jgi:hypothetical protein
MSTYTIDPDVPRAQTLPGAAYSDPSFYAWQQRQLLPTTWQPNWMLYVDNYLEGLHIPLVHPALNRALDLGAYRVEVDERSVLPVGLAAAGQAAFDLPAGHPDFGQQVAAYYLWLFPKSRLAKSVRPSARRARQSSRSWRWTAPTRRSRSSTPSQRQAACARPAEQGDAVAQADRDRQRRPCCDESSSASRPACWAGSSLRRLPPIAPVTSPRARRSGGAGGVQDSRSALTPTLIVQPGAQVGGSSGCCASSWAHRSRLWPPPRARRGSARRAPGRGRPRTSCQVPGPARNGRDLPGGRRPPPLRTPPRLTAAAATPRAAATGSRLVQAARPPPQAPQPSLARPSSPSTGVPPSPPAPPPSPGAPP